MKICLLLIATLFQFSTYGQLSVVYDEENNEICLQFNSCNTCLVGIEGVEICECRQNRVTEYDPTDFRDCKRDCLIEEFYEEDYLICLQNCEQNYGFEAFLSQECGNVPRIPEIINIEYRIRAATSNIGQNPLIIRDNLHEDARAVDDLNGFFGYNCLSLNNNWDELILGNNHCYWASMTVRYKDENGNIQFCEYRDEFCIIIG
jgi:hypothetical protein